MTRELLSIKEIVNLGILLCDVFDYITKIKKKEKLGDKIKYPQIPSILSESLAIHLLNKKIILSELERFRFDFGGRTADILANKNEEKIKIEVKATAKSAFQYFGPKDIVADYIIWIHFEDFFMDLEKNIVKIFIIKNPGKYFEKPVKITLSKLKQVIGEDLEEKEINVDQL